MATFAVVLPGERFTPNVTWGILALAVNPIEVEKEIEALEGRLDRAMLEADVDTLELLLGDALVYTYWSGTTDGKTAYVERIRTGSVVYHDIQRAVEHIQVYADVAVVIGRAHLMVPCWDCRESPRSGSSAYGLTKHTAGSWSPTRRRHSDGTPRGTPLHRPRSAGVLSGRKGLDRTPPVASASQ